MSALITGGYIWTSTMYNCIINRVHPSGTLGYTSIDLQPSAGASCLTSGLAVDSNNHLWVTSRVTPGFVFRVDANLDPAPVIGVVRNTGSNTAGVSIDSFGRPWATSIDRWGSKWGSLESNDVRV